MCALAVPSVPIWDGAPLPTLRPERLQQLLRSLEIQLRMI